MLNPYSGEAYGWTEGQRVQKTGRQEDRQTAQLKDRAFNRQAA